MAIGLLGGQFGAKHVEWRPVSTSMANATVFFALTRPGDVIMVQPESAGGNYSYNPVGPPRAANLDVRTLPFLETSFEVHLEEAVRAIRANRPKLVVVGGSNVLFPYPVAELRSAADEVGAKLLYDAAHVALYIASGLFQDPLREGAHILTFSSHKIMSGPVGGVILWNEDEIAEQILSYSFPTLIQTRDQNKFAALAYALAEMTEFGTAYAKQTVSNAHALAHALEDEGFEILCSDRGYTQTHQIFMLLSSTDSDDFEDRCQAANLLVTRAQRMGSSGRQAIRLTTQEITRRGMTEEHMPQLAAWLRRVIRDAEDPASIALEIRDHLTQFQRLAFSFDSAKPVVDAS
jgi:glycine hydroxymethyltransferase